MILNVEDKRELNDMIQNASDVKRETEQNEIYKKAIAKNIKYINQRIQETKERGLNYTCFIADSAYENELKRMYQAKGYRFKPTGYCGGVWQLSEDICW